VADEQPLNTEYLLNLMAKLQFMAQAANERRIQGHDPRYEAIVIKCKDLLNRLQKLIPAVMLNDIALFDRTAKEIYQRLGEKEDFAIKGEKDSGH
jgi:hypothetical protein